MPDRVKGAVKLSQNRAPDLAGQIGLVLKPTSFWGRLIAWWTNSPAYHTVLAIDNVRCISAEPGGARYREISLYPEIVFSHFDLTEEQRDNIVDWGIRHLGTSYNFAEDIAIGIGLRFGMKTPLWIQRYLSSDYILNCSQLCDAAYFNADIDLFTDHRLSGAVFPGSYVPLWVAKGWMKCP
jgi:hypothetical protein